MSDDLLISGYFRADAVQKFGSFVLRGLVCNLLADGELDLLRCLYWLATTVCCRIATVFDEMLGGSPQSHGFDSYTSRAYAIDAFDGTGLDL